MTALHFSVCVPFVESCRLQLLEADQSELQSLSQLKENEVADLRQRLLDVEPKYAAARGEADRLNKQLDSLQREASGSSLLVSRDRHRFR